MLPLKTTDKLSLVHSDIRGPIYQEALRMQKEGIEILKLNTGNPAAFGFEMPQSVREAILKNLDRAVPYCDVRGMIEAREAICAYQQKKGFRDITPDDIFIGNGVSELVPMITNATLSHGDELLLPAPSYSLWTNSVYLSGGKPVFYRCDEAQGWMPDLEDIRAKITKKTRAILLINPNNPTGANYSREFLLEIARIAREHNLVVFADEIYDRLVMDGEEHFSFAALAPDVMSVTVNGLSKSHVICGLRCGWMVIAGPKELSRDFADGIMKMASMRLCGNATVQLAIPAALEDFASTQKMILPGGRLYEQRRAATEALSGIEGLSFVKNRAAFYLFPKLDKEKFSITDDGRFAMDFLHAKHILIVPGSGFDWQDGDHFRIVMLPEKEILRKACLELGDFLSDYKQN